MKPSLREIKANISIKRMVIQRQQWDKWQNKQTNKKNQPPERIYMLAAAAGSTGSDTEGRGDHPTK